MRTSQRDFHVTTDDSAQNNRLKMDDERLIKTVLEFPCLWQVSSGLRRTLKVSHSTAGMYTVASKIIFIEFKHLLRTFDSFSEKIHPII